MDSRFLVHYFFYMCLLFRFFFYHVLCCLCLMSLSSQYPLILFFFFLPLFYTYLFIAYCIMTLIRTLNEDTYGGGFPPSQPLTLPPYINTSPPSLPCLWVRSPSFYWSFPVHGHRMWRHVYAHWSVPSGSTWKILIVSHMYTTQTGVKWYLSVLFLSADL